MKTKLFLAAGALAFAGLSAATATSFEYVFSAPMEVGSTQLRPGAYFVGQKGDCAVFRNVSNGKTYKAYGKVVYLGQKNDTTSVMAYQGRIDRIAVNGHATELQFPG